MLESSHDVDYSSTDYKSQIRGGIMKINSTAKKVILGSLIALTYALASSAMIFNDWGVFPMVAIASFFSWLFYLVTDIDLLGLKQTDKDESPSRIFKGRIK